MQVGIKIDNGVDAAELYRRWLPRAIGMAAKLRLEDADWCGSAVLGDFITSGYHQRWQPDGGQALDSYVYTIVHLRLLKHLRQQKTRMNRTAYLGPALIHQAQATEGTTASNMSSRSNSDDRDVTGAAGADIDPGYELVDSRLALEELAERVALHDRSNSQVGPATLIHAIIQAVLDDDDTHDAHWARTYGVSHTTVRGQRLALVDMLTDLAE